MDKLEQIKAVIEATAKVKQQEAEKRDHVSNTIRNVMLRSKQIKESQAREDAAKSKAYDQIAAIMGK